MIVAPSSPTRTSDHATAGAISITTTFDGAELSDDAVDDVNQGLQSGAGAPGYRWLMPFSDEFSGGVTVVSYDQRWPVEFDELATRLVMALGSIARGVDHIGSTSVPGLAAKNCIDVQVRVDHLDEAAITAAVLALGLRRRPEPWNQVDIDHGRRWPKLVFAPPIGGRASNVHVRQADAATTRRNLLFRDFLRADSTARNAWGAFKSRLAQSVPDLADYGQIKQPATEVLMHTAHAWASRTRWRPPPPDRPATG